MTTTIINNSENSFEWVDLHDPSHEEICTLAEKYQLEPESVEDVFQPEHLPKCEILNKYVLIIFRVYHVTRESDADTVPELTNKVAVFISEKFIISVHKQPWAVLENKDELTRRQFRKPEDVLHYIALSVLLSFDNPGKTLGKTIDYFEEHVFLKNRKTPLLKSLYYLKRKVEVIKGILTQTSDSIEYIDPPGTNNPVTRNIRDLYQKQASVFRNLADNTTHLLSIYFNISSQRTNETIRVLTIFSVFFMPLTFIVGVYGMNFDVMPELRLRFGYPLVWLLMIVVVVAIYIWFKKKKWL